MKLHLLVAAAAAFVPVPASAASYLLTYQSTVGAAMTASLRITTANTVNAAGGYDIQAVTGTIVGNTVSSLVANPNPGQAVNSADDLFTYDNVYFAGHPLLSNPGILFRDTQGFEYNLFSRNASQYDLYQALPGVRYTMNSVGSLSTLAVPEPAQWAMIFAGFLLIGSMLRRQRTIRVTYA